MGSDCATAADDRSPLKRPTFGGVVMQDLDGEHLIHGPLPIRCIITSIPATMVVGRQQRAASQRTQESWAHDHD